MKIDFPEYACEYSKNLAAKSKAFAMQVYDPPEISEEADDGFGADPKFVLAKDAVHPYSLRLSSPLIGRGRVCDWMTGAYDIRGEEDDGKYLRVRDGKVDIGCYQCWLNPVGMTVVVR